MRPCIVDSSIWISFFNEKDELHEKALVLMEYILNHYSTIIVPGLVFVETINAFHLEKYTSELKKVREFWFHLQQCVLDVEGSYFTFTILPLIKNPNQLKASDFIIYCFSIHRDAELFTFDKKLQAAYKSIKKS